MEPPPRQDSLTLLTVEPPQGSRFQLGEEVAVVARLRHSFATATSGHLRVLVFQPPFGLPLLTDPIVVDEPVEGSEGETVLEFRILLVEILGALRAGPITANVVLFPEGQSSSSISAQIQYQLVL